MENKNVAGVKLLLQRSRTELEFLARGYNLCSHGLKIDLAKRIYEHQEKKFTQSWKEIVG
jgi:hypothetical protein